MYQRNNYQVNPFRDFLGEIPRISEPEQGASPGCLGGKGYSTKEEFGRMVMVVGKGMGRKQI